MSSLDYDLPLELIAQSPTPRREESRLMVVHPPTLSHAWFHELPELIKKWMGPQVLLVLNNTKVLPARLFARKMTQGKGKVELLLCDPLHTSANSQTWRCMYRASHPLRPQTYIELSGTDAPEAQIITLEKPGWVQIKFTLKPDQDFFTYLQTTGEIPLPPYIQQKSLTDAQRYQTVFAQHPGAVAAPTAGLHFSQELLNELTHLGYDHTQVTLHVGPGTFMPMHGDDPTTHQMHAERYHIEPQAAQRINEAKQAGYKILAVGTTVARTLESAFCTKDQRVRSGDGVTSLFIYPPYRFRSLDGLITNFHLPKSTLLYLVAALLGEHTLIQAYQTAIAQRYRFFSYGDAMFIPKIYYSS